MKSTIKIKFKSKNIRRVLLITMS